MRKLTPKQEIFVAEYLAQRLNGTQAAIAAGYSRSNARHYAARLLTKANVRAELSCKARRLLNRLRWPTLEPGTGPSVHGYFDLARLPAEETVTQCKHGTVVRCLVRRASGDLLQSTWTPLSETRDDV